MVASEDFSEAWVRATEDNPCNDVEAVAVAIIEDTVKVRHDLWLKLGRVKIRELGVYVMSSGVGGAGGDASGSRSNCSIPSSQQRWRAVLT